MKWMQNATQTTPLPRPQKKGGQIKNKTLFFFFFLSWNGNNGKWIKYIYKDPCTKPFIPREILPL